MGSADKKSSLEEQIDDNLKKVFQQEVEKEIPSRFLDLLSQLKEQDASKGGEAANDD